MRALRIAALLEALSPAVLLVNLATVHAETVTRLGGPLHGTSYVAVVITTALVPKARGSGAGWLSVIPGVGGLLARRRLRTRELTRTG
ncbi:DUF3817 domain-containing protein [Phytomonospora sp. NPDC050363]|uniref:DUF3817 domain-containing protein n=1 Tax=Phytomonospora sp. NPDC050363 TaxID=3155642 RepID=UPI003407542C